MNAPVMIFTYRRPEHTKSVIDALAKNIGAKETEVYAFTCGPKNEADRPCVEATKSILEDASNSHAFKSFQIFGPEKHIPLGVGMRYAVNEIIKINERVIVIEDDIITSTDFLKYMNEALDRYQDDKRVFSIGAYTPAIPSSGLNKRVIFTHKSCSWGWGTWSDRWEKVTADIEDYNLIKYSREKRKIIARAGGDIEAGIDFFMNCERNRDKHWDIQFVYCQLMNNGVTVCPSQSKTTNIGFDGSGTGRVVDIPVNFLAEGGEWEFTDVIVNEKINDEYNDLTMSRMYNKTKIRISNSLFKISPRLQNFVLRFYGKIQR